MYRLNSLNADIQLIVDGAWERSLPKLEQKPFVSFVKLEELLTSIIYSTTLFYFVILP